MDGATVESQVLLMTDVEGSTRQWHDHPGAMNRAMARHHEIVHRLVESHGGWRPVDQGEGDSVFAAFSSPAAAVEAAAAIQRALLAEAWPDPIDVRVRIGIHVGDVIRRSGNLWGDTVNKCARIRALGAGGQTLVSSAVWAQLRDRPPPGISFTDLGEHRMKDLTRPERIHQVDVAGVAGEFPPLRSLDRARHNLPVQSTALIGRDADVTAVRRLLEQHRLVTLLGFGGIGKTRLALEVGAAVAAGDADGVWFIDLSSVRDPEMVPAHIAEALGIKESGSGAADAVLEDLASKTLLLILDNLEQVLGCAPFIASLLARAPGVAVLATSREALRIRGEQEYAVETLTTPDAVALFTSRAAAVRNGFTLDPVVADTVVSISARLDGHPLAIELAAARMKVLTAEALLARLDSALAVLTSGGRDRPERHKTLRATIEWSYEMLAPEERMLLARLSIFPGSMTLDAIEAICGAALGFDGVDVLDTVTALVEKSLLRALPMDDSDPQPRYDMLVSVREYAAERLAASGGTEEMARRHVDHYAELNRLDVESPEEGLAVIRGIERELHNYRAALEWAQSNGTARDETRFSTFLRVLVDSGHFEEARAAALHAVARDSTPSPGRVWMWSILSYLYWHTAEHHLEAEAAARQLAEARVVGEPSLIASALVESLQNATTREDLLVRVAEADALIAALPAAHNEVPLWFQRELRDNRVSIALRFADPDLAWSAAHGYYAATRFDQFIAGLMIGQLAIDRGRWAEAEEVMRDVRHHVGLTWTDGGVEDVDDEQEGRDVLLQTMLLRVLAQAALGAGEVDAAFGYATSAISRLEPLDLPHWLGLAHLVCGNCHFAARGFDDAVASMTAAAALVEPESAGELTVQWRLARAERMVGRSGDARTRLDAARRKLAGKELGSLTDVLGADVELARHLIDEDPATSARLLARVRRDLRDFVLPLGTDDEADELWQLAEERIGDAELERITAEIAAQPLWSS